MVAGPGGIADCRSGRARVDVGDGGTRSEVDVTGSSVQDGGVQNLGSNSARYWRGCCKAPVGVAGARERKRVSIFAWPRGHVGALNDGPGGV